MAASPKYGTTSINAFPNNEEIKKFPGKYIRHILPHQPMPVPQGLSEAPGPAGVFYCYLQKNKGNLGQRSNYIQNNLCKKRP